MSITKEKIIEILKAHTEDMEGYSYFGPNMGVPEDDYEEIADEILTLVTCAEQASGGGK